MKQTKRRNSPLGISEYYKLPKEYLTEDGTCSTKGTRNNWSKDLIVSLEEIIKKVDSSDILHAEKDYDSPRISKASKQILGVSTQYSLQFSVLSCQLEKWSAQRRMLMKEIERLTKSLDQTKSLCAKGRLIFSAIDISGTLGSSILETLNSSWSPKILVASAAFGCLSLACSLIEISTTKSILEQAVKDIKEDNESLRSLEILFLRMRDFDRSVQDLFPHGVDIEIFHMLQSNIATKPIGTYPETIEGMQGLTKALPTSTLNKRIWLSIILTNALKDISILEDEDFLSKADKFSKSRVAEIWWKRMQCKEFPVTPKSELVADLKSCLEVGMTPLHAVPLLSTPLWYTGGLHTIGSVIVNGLTVFDSYCGLQGYCRTKELDTLRQLNQVLQKEYDEVMKLYEKLNPHYD